MSDNAVIAFESDDDYIEVSGTEQALDDGIILDVSPDGIFSTGYTTITRSGAFQIGGDAVGDEIPIREVILPLDIWDAGAGIEANVNRVRHMFRMGHTVTFKYTSERSGLRWLKIRPSKSIQFVQEQDWNMDGHAHAIVTAIAVQPHYQSPEDVQTWTKQTSGAEFGTVEVWNPTDQRCYLEWDIDPGTWAFPDWSFGLESEYDRVTGADHDRMITTPALSQRLSVMADPQYDTYISANLSNAAGLFNGVEPLYWLPPYTPPTEVTVFGTGPAGRQMMCTMRRFWSAESGLEAGFA